MKTQYIHLNQIKPPMLYREPSQELRDAIKEQGLLETLVVFEEAENLYTLLDGFKRYFVCCELGISYVQCDVIDPENAEDRKFITT